MTIYNLIQLPGFDFLADKCAEHYPSSICKSHFPPIASHLWHEFVSSCRCIFRGGRFVDRHHHHGGHQRSDQQGAGNAVSHRHPEWRRLLHRSQRVPGQFFFFFLIWKLLMSLSPFFGCNCIFFFVKGRGHYLFFFFKVFIVFCSLPVIYPVYPNIRQSMSVLGSKPPKTFFPFDPT